ncbi:hypothetical protein ARAM_004109 [Aspergillus rambellii]|uniref:Pyruvate decarboxylase n=1 Tax=Aspergillus rambellii TaxID=308745 RepID=A0A0F8UKY9_9EURO|nr:hypothetical protein ARAM_004109 [Aspergillus rambellii]
MPFFQPSLAGIPSTQWAYVRQAGIDSKDIEMTRIPVPTPGPDDVLVHLQYSGVCHSDYSILKQEFNWPPGSAIVGGHEGAGIVVAIGQEVHDLRIGDRIGIQLINAACGACNYCDIKDNRFCPNPRMSGYSINGTFQQYAVCKAANAVRIPPEIPLEDAAPVLCAGVTSYNAVKACNLKPGQMLAVVGAGGGLGTFACQYAKAMGFRVLAISAGPEKRRMCMESLGADLFIDYSTSSDLVSEVIEASSGGPHAALVLSPFDKPYNLAIQYVRPEGTVVAAGIPHGTVAVDVLTVIQRQITFKGSYIGTREDTEEALDIMSRCRFPVQSKIMDFSELPTVYDLMEKGKFQGRAVLRIGDCHYEQIGEAEASPRLEFHQDQYNIGTFLAYRMQEIGISDYFVVPGDMNMNLLDEILKNKALRMVGCCNELNAGYAADGYARASPSGVAVVIVTFMVGGLSVINAIAGAYSEHLKVIVVSGFPGSKLVDHPLVHHSLGTREKGQALRAFKEVTTASVRLDAKADPANVLDETIRKCFRDSLPVYIEIPADIATLPCAAPRRLRLEDGPFLPTDKLNEATDAMIKTWNLAIRPVIIVGAWVRRKVPTDMLVALAEKLGCAVYCQFDSKSLFPETHPQFAGAFWGAVGSPECDRAVMESDLWVVLGGRWSDIHTTGRLNIHNEEAHRILDLQEERITLPSGETIAGVSLYHAVAGLIDADIPRKDTIWRASGSVTKGANGHGVTHSAHSFITLAGVIQGIQSIVKPSDTLIIEAGDTLFHSQELHLPEGADLQMQNIYASIGWSLPAALGCQLARPDGRCILLIGDGSLRMTVQELGTMIEMKANSVIFIFNNLGYAIESAIQDGPYNYFANWNYAALATSMNYTPHFVDAQNPFTSSYATPALFPVFALQIKTTSDLVQALKLIEIETDKLVILDCCIHPQDVSPMLHRLAQQIADSNRVDNKENGS